MSNEQKALVARLRSVDISWSETGEWCAEAADLIEAQAAEIARLRDALHNIDIEAANTIPSDGEDAPLTALFRITQIVNPFRLPSAVLAQETQP